MESPKDEPNLSLCQKRKRSCPNSDNENCKYQKLQQDYNKTTCNEDIKDVGVTVAACHTDRVNFKFNEVTIEDLPSIVMVNIFKCLSLHELLMSACLVCKQWQNLTKDPDLWREIDLKWPSQITDEIFIRLCSYSGNVTSLCVPNLKTKVTEKGINTVLQKCSNLRRLVLAGSMFLERSAFDAIGEHCDKLVCLDLSRCCNMDDAALTKIANHCKLLEHVYVSQCQYVSDDGVKILAQSCPRMRVFAMKHNTKVTDSAVETICYSCNGLEELYLTRCDVTGNCLKHIAKLSHLRILEFASLSPVTASEISQVVKNCPKLTQLNLSLCQSVNDSCIDVIVKYTKRLSSLYLVSCGITDKSLLNLTKSCKDLERLDVGYCQAVTDCGVIELCHGCPKLKYLGLMRCDSVTHETVLTLSNKFPQCTISTVWLDCYRLLKKAGRVGESGLQWISSQSGFGALPAFSNRYKSYE